MLLSNKGSTSAKNNKHLKRYGLVISSEEAEQPSSWRRAAALENRENMSSLDFFFSQCSDRHANEHEGRVDRSGKLF